MSNYDNSELEKTKAEAKARWGDTDAYKQYEEKTKNRSEKEQSDAAEGLDRIMEAFSVCMKNGGSAGFLRASAPFLS